MTTLDENDAGSTTPYDAVDARLATLVDEFGPAAITELQRAEDLVAASLVMYGAAFRRARQLAEELGHGRLAASWSDADPLGRLLSLHLADSPAPPSTEAEEVQRATGTIEAILDELEDDPPEIRERSVEMLSLVSDLHEIGLAQLVGADDATRRPPADLAAAFGADHRVASVLLVHGLHPESLEQRLARVIDDLDRRGGAVASVRVTGLDDAGVHLHIDGVSPNDAHRFRLEVERTLGERLPDLPVASVAGGEEPVQPTSVLIPVESVTVRRS